MHLIRSGALVALANCARDLTDSESLPLTQECSQMIGVQRNAVSMVANALQRAVSSATARADQYNVAGLKETACECYQAVKVNVTGW
jgi:hypothetical protein